jgi:hypothetical protein
MIYIGVQFLNVYLQCLISHNHQTEWFIQISGDHHVADLHDIKQSRNTY